MSREKKTKTPAGERVAKAVERRSYIDRLNERYAVVCIGNKTAILKECPGDSPEFMPVEDFHLWFKNDRVTV
jgi:hypothetical protein